MQPQLLRTERCYWFVTPAGRHAEILYPERDSFAPFDDKIETSQPRRSQNEERWFANAMPSVCPLRHGKRKADAYLISVSAWQMCCHASPRSYNSSQANTGLAKIAARSLAPSFARSVATNTIKRKNTVRPDTSAPYSKLIYARRYNMRLTKRVLCIT